MKCWKNRELKMTKDEYRLGGKVGEQHVREGETGWW